MRPPRPTPESLFGVTRDDMFELHELEKGVELVYGGRPSSGEVLQLLLVLVAQLRKRVTVLEQALQQREG